MIPRDKYKIHKYKYKQRFLRACVSSDVTTLAVDVRGQFDVDEDFDPESARTAPAVTKGACVRGSAQIGK